MLNNTNVSEERKEKAELLKEDQECQVVWVEVDRNKN